MKVGVLCSGQLGFEILKRITEKYPTSFVLTDNGSVAIKQFCEKEGIPYWVGNPRNGKGYSFIKNNAVDVIASINYLFIIEEDIINHAKKLAFNIHGSLLPKYRGRTPHVWAIINNESETGITAHKIDVGCDTGDIIKQVVVPITSKATGADVLTLFKQQYPKLALEVLDSIAKGTIQFKVQDNSKATFFGKRTPTDGLINWDWHKERISNWIRAQAAPYPGAFTFYKGQKVIIDKVTISDFGFENEMENGTILLNGENIIVKTSNGAIEITQLRETMLGFEINTKFENE